MAIHCASVADYLQRTTGLLSPASNSTVMCWYRPVIVAVPANYQSVFVVVDDPVVFAEWASITNDTGGTYLEVSGTVGTPPAAPTANTWVHLAWTQTGTTQRLYVNGVLSESFTKDRSAYTVGYTLVGGDTYSAGNVDVAYYREWSAYSMTAAEIQAEMISPAPVRTANLFTDTPLSTATDLADDSGNGHDWTGVGSLATATSPVFPANQTAATALTVTLPYGIAQDLMGTDVTTWYALTPTTGLYYVSWYSYPTPDPSGYPTTGYRTQTTVWTGTPPSLTQTDYSDARYDTVYNRALTMPVVPGTTYYVKVVTQGAVASTLPSLALSALAAPTATAPAGSLLINDDGIVASPSYATVLLDADTGETLQLLPNVYGGEMGDLLTSGTFALSDVGTQQVRIYSASGTEVASANPPLAASSDLRNQIRSDGTQFYVASTLDSSTTTKLWRLTASGTLSAPVTISTTTGAIRAMGVTRDSASAYWAYQGAVDTINTWDLGTDTAGSTFWTAPAAVGFCPDILCLSDGAVVSGMKYLNQGAAGLIYVIDSGGTTTVTITAAYNGLNRLARVLGDDSYIWAWFYNSSTSVNTFVKYATADGTALDSFTRYTTANGYGFQNGVASPDRFGPSSTCPFLIMPAVSSPTPGTLNSRVLRMRWLRRAPHLIEENRRMFYSQFELAMNVGSGLREGQGDDPDVMLRWSDDGGHTWSNEHWRKSGKRGEFKRRVRWLRLGQGRDRVFEVSGSDPVAVALVMGWLEVEEGLS